MAKNLNNPNTVFIISRRKKADKPRMMHIDQYDKNKAYLIRDGYRLMKNNDEKDAAIIMQYYSDFLEAAPEKRVPKKTATKKTEKKTEEPES